MRLTARTAEGAGKPIEIEGNPPSVSVSVNGETRTYDVVSVGPGVWSIISPAGVHLDLSVEPDGDDGFRVTGGPRGRISFELLDELAALALAETGRGRSRKSGEVRAAIPGRVVRVLVAKGDMVELGQPLLVLEAMKMENEVRAASGGTVGSVEVQAGQAVGAGQLLVRLGE